MSKFKSLYVKKFQKNKEELSAESIYWKKLSVPTLVKEFGAIDYIDFSPVQPHYFAVTCSVRVQIYNPITKLVAKNLSRFQQNAYGGSFRQDGRLLVAGDEEGFVKLFDTSSKNILRMFKGHKSAVHRTFFTPDLLHIVSFSDDRTVKLWDIANEKVVQTFAEHSDYVRAGCVNPVSSNIILSGGYDNKINLCDTRTNNISFSVDHGSPIESLLFLPSGGIFLSAGGTEIKVWDALAGGKLLARLSQHHKTVTCLRLASNGRRILSSGLDRHVKFYDVATYECVYNLDFPNSVLSLAVSPNDQTVVAGMVNGLFSIQNMEKPDNVFVEKKFQRPLSILNADRVVEDFQKDFEARYEHWLRKYDYSRALDEVMKPYSLNKNPHITVGLMQELIKRKGLHRAVAGRSHSFLGSLIRFIKKYIGEHRFMSALIEVSNVIIDVYEESFDQFNVELRKLFLDFVEIVNHEVRLSYELLELQGALELITTAAGVSEDVDESFHFTKDTSNLKQSEYARDKSVLVV